MAGILREDPFRCARFERADLAAPAEVRRLAAAAGEVDVLVNNAGIFRFASTADTSFDDHVEVNLWSPFLLVQALVPGMVRRARGAAVNVRSGAASVPGAGNGVYGASKVALWSR